MRNFRELKVREKSHRLTLDIYKVTAGFPRHELYGLTSQTRRSCANIAGGCGRGGKADLACFLQMAMGSATELEYHLLLARDLGLLEAEDHERLSSEVVEVVKRGIVIRSLRAFSNQQPKA